ncbi:hypothetical protein A7J50_1020 [Pseudomonas antarctica]|jgi:hypothetical protein|uniref:Protein GltF n=1 Tax=Pseudomonas antarctica TaxID=219572 RepID=A0A172YW84_9PSED|nr:DUF1120 domain-containing protein [Pseudomonas antarctica]ANF84461.1 hypothetical protein A7J50_1020 [Pseudomonas antarctica]
MQPSRVLITAALLLAGVSNVMAASSVDLGVVGVITPSACTPTLSNNGVVDHGKVSVLDFPESGNKALPTVTLQLVVTCNAPMLMAVKATDNRAGTALYPWPEYFGLGLARGGEKIGMYMLVMGNASADDVPGIVIDSYAEGRWSNAEDTYWAAGVMRTVSSTGLAPLPLTTFKADLEVETTLTDKKNLPISDEIQIDGNATLDVVYL